jgi:hypothetical protein
MRLKNSFKPPQSHRKHQQPNPLRQRTTKAVGVPHNKYRGSHVHVVLHDFGGALEEAARLMHSGLLALNLNFNCQTEIHNNCLTHN